MWTPGKYRRGPCGGPDGPGPRPAAGLYRPVRQLAAQLAQEGSRDNLPQDNDPGYDPGYDPDYQDDGGLGLVGLVILLVVVFLIVRVAAASDG